MGGPRPTAKVPQQRAEGEKPPPEQPARERCSLSLGHQREMLPKASRSGTHGVWGEGCVGPSPPPHPLWELLGVKRGLWGSGGGSFQLPKPPWVSGDFGEPLLGFLPPQKGWKLGTSPPPDPPTPRDKGFLLVCGWRARFLLAWLFRKPLVMPQCHHCHHGGDARNGAQGTG